MRTNFRRGLKLATEGLLQSGVRDCLCQMICQRQLDSDLVYAADEWEIVSITITRVPTQR
jgi:hypothetical protein